MQQPTPALPAPPASPSSFRVHVANGTISPVAQYEAATAQREELGQQLDNLQHQRNRITEELTNQETRGADRTGLESRLTAVDARIAAMDKQIAAADEQVAQTAALPNAVTGHREIERVRQAAMRDNNGAPEEAFVVGGLFIIVVFLPLSIAFARRIWKRGAAAVTALPSELMERLSRLDQAVESIAIEVERIGEGQRFVTRVMTDAGGRAIGAAPAEPIRQAVRDAVPVPGEGSR